MTTQESPDRSAETDADSAAESEREQWPEEVGGPKGKEPTRYGDWEKNGRCIDF
jgi:hypothetical protein